MTAVKTVPRIAVREPRSRVRRSDAKVIEDRARVLMERLGPADNVRLLRVEKFRGYSEIRRPLTRLTWAQLDRMLARVR